MSCIDHPQTPSLRREGDGMRPAIFDTGRRVRFLSHLADAGNVRIACRAAGVSAETAYRARRRDAAFALGWSSALVLARRHAEAVLASRALDGVEEVVFYHGEEIARRVRYDSRLLLAHLARLDIVCADPAAERGAERFDELLAVIGGEGASDASMRSAAAFAGKTGAGELGAGETGAVGEGEGLAGLAATREDYADYHSRIAGYDAEEAGAAEGLSGEELTDYVVEAEAVAREEAGAAYDAKCRAARDYVDGLYRDEGEVGPDGVDANGEGERKSLDPVNCVNFS